MCLFGTYSCHILRLQCGKFADFSIHKPGRIDAVNVIGRFQEIDRFHCYDLCIHDNRCKAVNIANESDDCELVSVSPPDLKDQPVTVDSEVGWEYHTTNYSSHQVISLFYDIKLR